MAVDQRLEFIEKELFDTPNLHCDFGLLLTGPGLIKRSKSRKPKQKRSGPRYAIADLEDSIQSTDNIRVSVFRPLYSSRKVMPRYPLEIIRQLAQHDFKSPPRS